MFNLKNSRRSNDAGQDLYWCSRRSARWHWQCAHRHRRGLEPSVRHYVSVLLLHCLWENKVSFMYKSVRSHFVWNIYFHVKQGFAYFYSGKCSPEVYFWLPIVTVYANVRGDFSSHLKSFSVFQWLLPLIYVVSCSFKVEICNFRHDTWHHSATTVLLYFDSLSVILKMWPGKQSLQ